MTENNPNIITYSNWFEFEGRKLSFRKKELFDITGIPKIIDLKDNNGSKGYFINRKWLSLTKAQELVKKENIEVDVSELQWYQQERLRGVFDLGPVH